VRPCPWCDEEIDPDDETAPGPSTHIGETVTMHADCAFEANLPTEE
jgi:hypothetical protein